MLTTDSKLCKRNLNAHNQLENKRHLVDAEDEFIS